MHNSIVIRTNLHWHLKTKSYFNPWKYKSCSTGIVKMVQNLVYPNGDYYKCSSVHHIVMIPLRPFNVMLIYDWPWSFLLASSLRAVYGSLLPVSYNKIFSFCTFYLDVVPYILSLLVHSAHMWYPRPVKWSVKNIYAHVCQIFILWREI